MSDNKDKTDPGPTEFDFSRYPFNSVFHERRTGNDRRDKKSPDAGPGEPSKDEARPERRARKERRRRIDPTTFDKQYTDAEMEFMNAMQRFKESSGKSFPTYREVLRVVVDLGYRRAVAESDTNSTDAHFDETVLIGESTVDA